MPIFVNNPVQSTVIFSIFFILALALTLRRSKKTALELIQTQELKGLAILAIVFSHLGYFLVSDDRFLFPWSIAAGVGVNLFLFLSGYGLTVSALTKNFSIKDFYRRRLSKLYVPLWLVIILFLSLDWLINQRIYSFSYIIESMLGFFKSADLWQDLNSPLWYFTVYR